MADEIFTQAWADDVKDAINNYPDADYRATKLDLFWDWIVAARTGFSGGFAIGVRDLPANGAAKEVFAKFTIDAGDCTKAEIVDREMAMDSTFVLVGDYQVWKDIVEGYDSGKAVMYRRLRLEKGDVFRFFNRIYFFTESLVALSKVPAKLPA
jgi:putative sterol carrier protein